MRQKTKWILLALTLALAAVALWQLQRVAKEMQRSEEAKVKLWAAAIDQRNRITEVTQAFFAEATRDEHRKMRLYTDILQSFNDPDQNTDLQFSLAYVNYIIDSSQTDIVIVNSLDSVITAPKELAGEKLQGNRLAEYAVHPPFHYTLWGMPMTLYYKESASYLRLQEALQGLMLTFLNDVTNNSILVPVVIVDSSRQEVLAFGNLDSADIATPHQLEATLHRMENANDPLTLTMLDGRPYYVYYSSTLMLRLLHWMPLLWVVVALALVVVSYNLFRTARTAEQNRIWVGLAKETAHQLGTPISSLSGWMEYLQGKEMTPTYAAEIAKDLTRLETITHRFSKIGATPELVDTDVAKVIGEAMDYLRNRTPRHTQFRLNMPEGETLTAPLNSYLFQWVIENLCKNAVDAMDGEGAGDRQEPAREHIIGINVSQDARKIYIDISDTGRGMTPSVQKHIFDSGFTTKTRGWGLGLPLSRRIINQYHRGRLYLKYSIPGQGSCFRIVLKKKI